MKKAILIADDSDVIRSIVEQTLRLYHYENIITAIDGQDALEKAKAHQNEIALFVFDVNMPRMDGIQLVEEVRKFDTTTPIIMLTTETDKAKMMAARERGATGWIIKPFQGEKFIRVVEMYVKS
ncbi:MAG: response regulator [Treponemataceae bacterium]|nr:response regulator [Treponemataceae bacterium]